MIKRTNRQRLLGSLTLLFLLARAGPALAQTSDLPAAFADIGWGARPMGMGGAFVALADDANAVLWNPAGLTNPDRPQLTGMYVRQMGLVPSGFMGVALPLWERMSIGAGAVYSGDASLRELTALISGARKIRQDLSVGLTAKARMATYGDNADGAWDPGGGNRQVEGSALGFGLDLGLLWCLTDRTSLGLMWRDIIAPVSWQASNQAGTARGGGESIPMALTVGTAHRWHEGATMSVSLDRSLHSDSADRISMGFENRLWELIFVRAGYGQQITADPDRLYALGLGVEHDFGTTWNMSFDFAYLFHQLANTPKVSLTLHF
jgi:hypothetical protein